MSYINQIINRITNRRRFVMLFVIVGIAAAVISFRSPAGTIPAEAVTFTVLHLHGNTEDTPVAPATQNCTGNGSADLNACGGPFMLTNAVLSTSQSARWVIPNPAAQQASPAQNNTVPNWIWNLTSPVRLGGPMTLNWWASCAACGPTGNADWNIRIFADGLLKLTQRIRVTPAAPNVPSRLTFNVDLPDMTANSNYVLHIAPVFIDSQNDTMIYYDSQSSCTPTTTGPCDSTVIMPVLAPGEPLPTPTPAPTPPGPSACALPTYDNYQPPVNTPGTATAYPRRNGAAEPSIGVNWNTGNVMTMHRLLASRTTFDDSTSPANPMENTGHIWFPRSIQTLVTGLDPILFTDPVTGRTIAGELQGAGGTTNGVISDDDLATVGATFQTGGATQGTDHQTIGGGAPNRSIANRQPTGSYPNLFYYASQEIAFASVATSFDGGMTYEPAVPAYTLAECGGLHGHIKVAPDGTVYLPNKGCGGRVGVAVSVDNGLNWNVRIIPTSTSGRSDPSVGIGAGGRLFVAYTSSDNHPHVAISDDKGLNWHDDSDLAGTVTPGLRAAAFTQAVAGDNNRVAVFFLGTTSTNPLDPAGTDNGGAGPNFAGTWYPYIATTCDAGKTWSVVRADNDPMFPGVANPAQQGVICQNGTTCPAGPPDTRNLADFNEIAVDARGRILAVYADGCTRDGVNGITPHPCMSIVDNSGTRIQNQGIARMTIIRQRGGMRLFSAFDPGGPAAPLLSPPVDVEQEKYATKVKWAEPDDGGSPLTAYRIYRGPTGGIEQMIAEVKPGSYVYRDRFRKRDRSNYYYRVTAVNKYGESPRGAGSSAER